MRRNKKNIIFIIALLFMCLGIGYAYLTTTLSINGITDIDANNWDVYFDNIQVTNGSVTGSQVIDEAEVVDDTTVEFHVNLKKPGDFYEFTVDAKNDGTIDAMIESITKKLNNTPITNLPAYLNYTVTYEDDVELENNHLLEAETLETYKIRVEYRADINPNQLPSSAQSLDLSFGVEYVQADDNGTQVRELAYSIGGRVNLGEAFPNGFIPYTDIDEALTEHIYPMFIKHTVVNNIVNSCSVGLKIDNNIYYMIGGGATYNSATSTYNNDSKFFETNKNTLNTIFGADKCQLNTYANNLGEYHCSDNNIDTTADVYTNGNIWVTIGSRVCDVRYSNGYCMCETLGD